ncbi:glycosyl hydrolase family 61-domain-containing protein [Elsinoe ampelina]|uniref:Glycosyl hydrolase family 61-domain-containing protein n=1 Tax=Elsinoe ampelina TaxID=302913 RepID=A0A6A6G1S5_9PEZI|nr:glycosyl hydrolase family 61-domain-containing protein [Elsinoe ampelina]
MICHIGATPGQASIKATAGDEMTLHWTEWPRLHPGPVITYIANCKGDCKTVDKKALKFTKIDEDGLHSAKPMHWATDTLIDNNNTWVMKLPTDISTGNYVLRHEIIALQGAVNQNGAQSYPSCINFEVTGPGPKTFDEGTSPTTFYDANEPSIKIQVFYDVTKNYTIPGPPLGAGAGGAATPAPAPVPAPSPRPAPSPSTTPSPVSPAVPVVDAAPEDPVAATTPGAGAGEVSRAPGTLPVVTEAPVPSTTAAPVPVPPPTSTSAPVAPSSAPSPQPPPEPSPEPSPEPTAEPTASAPAPPEPTDPIPTPTEPVPSEPTPVPTEEPTATCTETRTVTATRPGPTGTGAPARGSRRYRKIRKVFRTCVASGKTKEECLQAMVNYAQAKVQRVQRAQQAQAARAQYAHGVRE